MPTLTGVCPHDCPDTCAWQVTVDDSGRAIDIYGHPDHPVTQGRLCGKVDRYLERVYHPNRLTTPLRRVGPKGLGEFEPVGWDEAITDIATRLTGIITEYGPEAVLPYSYAGTMGILQGEGMASRFLNRMGASQLAYTICAEAGVAGATYTLGRNMGMAPADFAHAELILLWGTNTLTSNMHLWPFVQEARKKGARVLVIDPARTRTARAADEWIPIRPGTDGALALALMHVLSADNLIDHDYVERYTVGFSELAERVKQYPPAWAAEITGIPAETIIAIAHDYAKAKPAAIRINYGLQRHAGGGMAVRNLTCLPALTGHWRQRGGGILLSTSGSFYLDYSSVQRPDLRARPARTINMIRLGDALSLDPARIAAAHHHPRPVDPVPGPGEAGPPVKALIVYNSNPAATAPDQAAVTAGLRRDDLFTVVLEHFQTDTANYADYILPATTQLEHWDLLKPYGHHYLALNRPAMAPVGDSLPNSAIFRRLAAGMGYDDPCFGEVDEAILRRFLAAQTHPTLQGVTWQRLLDQGFVRLNLPEPYLPFAAGNFPTPSGKCEFYSARAAADGYDPLPTWTPPKMMIEDQSSKIKAETSQSSIIDHGSLVCISPPAHSFLNSTFANLERFRGREGQPLLLIHPDDAAARGIVQGMRVRVSNHFGEAALTAHLSPDVMPGVTLAPGVWWRQFSPDGGNINQTTPRGEADMGGGALFYDVRVWVQPLAAAL